MNERIGEAVGIDLGTTYSSLAYLDQQQMPRVVADSSGQTVMPSVVFFDDAQVVVGDVALSQAHVRAERAVQFIKVHMGDPWRKQFDGQMHTPESISALILGQLVREAEQQIGPIRDAVITVPAYFSERRRRATQQAGEIAGLRVIGTLNEPISAALAYGLHRTDHEELAVIYDLGGGTFDVTVARIKPNELEELATAGNRQLGGRDWDQMLVEHVCDEFKQAHSVDPRDSPQALQDLLLECEKAKRRVCKLSKTSIRLHALGHDHTSEITRERFEALTAPLLQATRLTTELALDDAKLKWSQISRLVLVGGSTNMPAVRRMLQEASGITPDTAVNPVTAVAFGAAIYAHLLETGVSFKTLPKPPVEEPSPSVPDTAPEIVTALPPPPAPDTIKPPLHAPESPTILKFASADPAPEKTTIAVFNPPRVSFVTAHGVGVKTRVDQRWTNTVLIRKNTRIPVTVTKRFVATGNAAKGRFITIEITQGDTTDIDLAEVLGTGRIDLPTEDPVGNPVDVTMEFDGQGRLHTRAVYAKTGQSIDMTLQMPGNLRPNEVARFQGFLQQAGFARPFPIGEAIAQLNDSADDDSEDFIRSLASTE